MYIGKDSLTNSRCANNKAIADVVTRKYDLSKATEQKLHIGYF